MGPEHFWWGGMWIFPILMPVIMLTIFLVVIYLIFGRGCFRPPRYNPSEPYSNHGSGDDSAMEILKKRYARGEITKVEFEDIKDALS